MLAPAYPDEHSLLFFPFPRAIPTRVACTVLALCGGRSLSSTGIELSNLKSYYNKEVRHGSSVARARDFEAYEAEMLLPCCRKQSLAVQRRVGVV